MVRYLLFPFPILRVRGITLITLTLCYPIFGLVGSLNANIVTALVLLQLISLIAFAVYDYFRVKNLIKKLKINCTLNDLAYSGIKSELKIDLEVSNCNSKLEIELRPESVLNLKVEKEIYHLALDRTSSTITLTHAFTPLSRGQFSFNKLYLRLSYAPFFWKWQASFQLESAKTNVYPNSNVHSLNSIRSFQKLQAGNSISEQCRSEGREFDSLRKYSIGDDLRKVDWKRSARGRGLFVKNYRPETHQRISIAIDCSRRMSNQVGDRLQIEYATDAAAHLLQLAKAQEDEVGFFAFNHKIITSLACRKGKKQEKLISDALHSIKVGTLEPDYQLLTEWGQALRKRSLLVLITSISNPISLDGIKNALKPLSKKHLILVIAIADRDVQELAEIRANSLEDAYIVSAAVEQIAQIEKRKRQLKAVGIECLYCDASTISEMLHKKYYELKLTGKL